jgi:hypothetical protein
MEQFIMFDQNTFTLLDGEDLAIYASSFPNAIFAQVVGNEVYGYDIKAAGLMEKARGFLADCQYVPADLSDIEF